MTKDTLKVSMFQCKSKYNHEIIDGTPDNCLYNALIWVGTPDKST